MAVGNAIKINAVVVTGLAHSEEESTRRLLPVLERLVGEHRFQLVVFASESWHQVLCKASVSHMYYNTVQDVMRLMQDSCMRLVVGTHLMHDTASSEELWKDTWSVGTHALLRSVAFNYETIPVIIDSLDFMSIESKVSNDQSFAYTLQEKIRLAQKVFEETSKIDAIISSSLGSNVDNNQTVLVVGNGGREHAIAWKIAQSSRVSQVYVAPGNGGTEGKDHGKITNVAIDVHAHEELIKFALSKKISLCIIGPEAPLVAGLADKMRAVKIPTFGPSAQAATLEASKAFSKSFMERHGIPTAKFQVFTKYEEATAYLNSIDFRVVVKASGIAAGKGVIIPTNKEEALQAVRKVMIEKAFGAAGDEVVIEEFLEGEEVSLLAFCDGKTVVPMPGAQDHKRILDGDEGPNTGGMGAYAPAPCFTKSIAEEAVAIMKKVVLCMAKEGMPYVGCLYGGFILTQDGPRVLEFNCRWGDPETQVLLPLMSSDLFEAMLACAMGTLHESMVKWKKGAAVTVVLASEGYPEKYSKGQKISGIASSAHRLLDTMVFQAGTKWESSELVTSGGRVLAVSALGKNLKEAIDKAYKGVRHVSFSGAQYRKDIGLKGLLCQQEVKPIKIGVLGSTRGSSLQPIIDAIEAKQLNATIEVIISNKRSAGILERATKHGLYGVALSCKGKSREAFDAEVTETLKAKQVDVVLLIGYMRIVSKAFCSEWANKVLNVHPSLLPDFAGGMDLEVHQAVLDAGKETTGCTVHFVTEKVDEGPIAVQFACSIYPHDTAESLKSRVQSLEGKALLHALRMFQTGLLVPRPQKPSMTYADAGVDMDEGNLLVELIKPYCKATKRKGCDSDLGGFGGLFDLSAAGYTHDTVLVACTDGVGTKLKVANLVGQHDTVGIDLVAMCVNDLIVQGAEPLFFLDYYACGKLNAKEAADVVKGIANGCLQSNCGLIGGETAEMPSMYPDGDYDLAGFCVGAVKKSELLPNPVNASDVAIGLASSGIHSNGYSLVRKLVEKNGFQYSDPCPFEHGKTLGEALLEPTRIYVKQLMPVIQERGLVSALAHITGGGLTENIPRVFSSDCKVVIDLASWRLPPVFKWLQSLSQLSDGELTRTFNCGIGMVLLVPESRVDDVLSSLLKQGEKGFVIGKIESRQEGEEAVVYHGVLS